MEFADFSPIIRPIISWLIDQKNLTHRVHSEFHNGEEETIISP
jgi:hypothetical protein